MLTIRDTLPDGFLDCSANELGGMFDGPTLIELPGNKTPPLFVSILVHGNEDVGLGAIQRVLRAYSEQVLPRALMLFVGNVEAATKGQRRLDSQPDFNRIWPGAIEGLDTSEAAVMAQVHKRVVDREAFAAIDLHNNTGRNPHYSVICSSDAEILGLASLFTHRAVMFRGLPGTQTASFAGLVPAMTAECGKPGSAANEETVAGFLNRVFSLDQLPKSPIDGCELQLFHTIGVVRVRPEIQFGFGDTAAQLNLDPQLDRMNFKALKAGAVLGQSSEARPLSITDENYRDVADSFYSNDNGEIRLLREVTPAMLTVDAQVVRQDCLGYLMEPLQAP